MRFQTGERGFSYPLAQMTIESRRSGAALPESEEHYRAVAEAATDAIITIDSDSTILIVETPNIGMQPTRRHNDAN